MNKELKKKKAKSAKNTESSSSEGILLIIICAALLFVSFTIAGIFCLLPEPRGCAFLELGLFLTFIGVWGIYGVIRYTASELIARIKRINGGK